MKRLSRIMLIAMASLLFAAVASADILELKDGRVLQGHFMGGTRVLLHFEVNGEVQTFNVIDVVALTFTSNGPNSGAAPAATPPPPSDAPPTAPSSSAPPPQGDVPPPQQQPPLPQDPTAVAPPDGITIPAGQTILVRMIDGVDSSRNQLGDPFHASLETDILVNNALIARKGTDIYGRLAEVKESGHFSGSPELQLELTRMVINGREYPLASTDYTVQGKNRGGDTAKKVGGGAIAGAILGAIVGGGRGAAIGAGVGSAAGADVQVLTRGKQVKVPSETLLEFRLQQPVTVQAAQG